VSTANSILDEFLETCDAASVLESRKPAAKAEGVGFLRKENAVADSRLVPERTISPRHCKLEWRFK